MMIKMSKVLRKALFLAMIALLAGGAVTAEEAITSHRARITDPKVYIPLRESMTTMEMRFVDTQIMAAEDKVNFTSIQKALDDMDASAKKIQSINPNEALREPLEKLRSQISALKKDAKRKDRNALKADLDRVFETCFKCHQAHAPMM